MENNEIWTEVKGFEGIYEVSNTGKIKSKWRKSGICMSPMGKEFTYTVNEKILKSAKSKNGYLRVLLVDKDNDLRINKSIHRLVLENFNPVSNMENLTVNHIDGNKENNNLSNLEWATMKEQIAHALLIGLRHEKEQDGELNKMSILKNEDVIYIYTNPDNLSTNELHKKFNISMANINNIFNDKSWIHITKTLFKNRLESLYTSKKYYKATYKENIIYFTDMKNFLKDKNISYYNVLKLLKNRNKEYEGWSFEYSNHDEYKLNKKEATQQNE